MSSTDNQGSEQHRRASTRVGSVLKGKYKIDRVLGIGGMAVVYSATHRNQAEFAVKMLHPELSMHADVCARFLREGYAANSVKHPGVVMVVDDDVAEDGAAFLVMELLRGDGVEALWEKSGMRVSPRIAAAIVDQLLDVLSAAHEKGIIHRDIKPANLFLTHDGTVKVLDFGIARARDALASSAGNHTGTGMLLGTPAFMAPEQALAKTKEIDQQTDVWAAGATLFSLISGQFVHTGENAPQLLVNAATKSARSLSTIVQAPPEIVDVVSRATAFEKSERFSSARSMQIALRDACMRAFGAPSAKDLLAGNARDSAASGAAPLQVAVPAEIASAPTFDSSPRELPRQLAKPPSGPGTLPLLQSHPLGGTTAQPVSNNNRANSVSTGAHGIPAKSGAAAGIIASFVILAVVGIGVFFGVRAWHTHQTTTAAAASSLEPEPMIASGSPQIPPVPTAPTFASAAASSAMAAASTIVSPPPVIPTPVPATTDATPHVSHSSHAHSSATTTSSAAPATTKPSVAKPSCDPPFFFDSQGRKVFKPECT